MSNPKKAFTLVELIVVIVILAILATIAFLSFSSQSGSARDSVRLSDTTNIRKGLELRQAVAGVIPIPASPVVYTGGTTSTGVSGVTISQGTINASVLSTLSNGIKDPSGTEYKYSTISQGGAQPLYYQLALELENPTSLKSNNFNPFAESAFAAATDTSKVAQLKGNYSFDPSLPSLFVLSGSVTSASGGIYNPNICFVLDKSSTNTFSNKDNCVPKNMMSLKDYDSSLVGYWDMETLTAGGKLKDLSGNGNDGSGSNGVVIGTGGGMLGKASSFVGANSQFIKINESPTMRSSKAMTISTLFYVDNLQSGVFLVDKYHSGAVNGYTYGNYISQGGGLPGMQGYYRVNGEIRYDNGYAYDYTKAFHLLTSSYDGYTVRLYLDGKLVSQGKYASKKDIADIEGNTFFGGWIFNNDGTSGGNFLTGRLDDIKMYNRALSDTEIYQQAKSIGF